MLQHQMPRLPRRYASRRAFRRPPPPPPLALRRRPRRRRVTAIPPPPRASRRRQQKYESSRQHTEIVRDCASPAAASRQRCARHGVSFEFANTVTPVPPDEPHSASIAHATAAAAAARAKKEAGYAARELGAALLPQRCAQLFACAVLPDRHAFRFCRRWRRARFFDCRRRSSCRRYRLSRRTAPARHAGAPLPPGCPCQRRSRHASS